MKKLIMFAVAIALACAGQAASVDWSMSIAGQGATLAGNGAFVLAFAGSDYADIVKLVTVDGSDTLQADLAAKALATSSAVKNNRGNATASGALENSPASVFWMMFSDGSYDGGKTVTWTAATDVSGSFYEPPASGTAFGLNAASFANSGTIANVPEPTSGLLMLVGLAGLALRRRRRA